MVLVLGLFSSLILRPSNFFSFCQCESGCSRCRVNLADQMYERREVRLNPCLLLVTAVFIIATAAFVPLSIKGYINIPTHCSEFRLNDPYISWPYQKEQVKHTKELIVFGMFLLICLLMFSFLKPSSVNQVIVNLGDRLWYIIDIKLFRLFYVGYYLLLGYLMCLVFLGFVKHSAGELRPCFLAVCQPNMTLVEDLAQGQDPLKVLLTKDVCINQNVEYFCMSFFSGHTLSAFYAASSCCLLLYFMDFHKRQRLFSLRFLLGMLLLSASTWVAMTRLQDHYHHVIDVTVAGIVGVLVPIFLLYSPLHSFKEEDLGSKCGEIGPLLAGSG